MNVTIDAKARKAVFNLPTKPWQIRSPASAGLVLQDTFLGPR